MSVSNLCVITDWVEVDRIDEQMRHKALTFGWVGIWAKVLADFKIPDQKVALDLFNDPYHTSAGIGPNGYIIVGPPAASPPQPSLNISPQRIQLVTHSIDETCRAWDAFREFLLSSSSNPSIFDLQAYGLNIESEWADLGEVSADKWMGNSFVRPGLQPADSKKWTVLAQEVQFSVDDWCYDNRFTFTMQPRMNDPLKIYIKTSEHVPCDNLSLPDGTTLRSMLEDNLKRSVDITRSLFWGDE